MSHLIARCRLFLGQLNLPSLRKLLVAVAGGSVLLVGVAMLVLPGPAIVVIPLGLAILATEFLWAKRWLQRARALLPTTSPVKTAQPKPNPASPPDRPWYSPVKLWQRKTTVIAVLAIVGIISYLVLRYGIHAPPDTCRLPLLATLVLGGLPMLYELLRKLLKLEFGSDLLGGISIITSVLLGEYLAGSIIVLMLAGGEALES